jgi:hypothetical protein
MHEFRLSDFAGVVVSKTVEDTFDFTVRQLLAVLAQETPKVHQIYLTEVDLID